MDSFSIKNEFQSKNSRSGNAEPAPIIGRPDTLQAEEIRGRFPSHVILCRSAGQSKFHSHAGRWIGAIEACLEIARYISSHHGCGME